MSFSVGIGLLPLQIILVILWYTVIPAASAWVIFIPLLIVGAFLGAWLLVAAAVGAMFWRSFTVTR